MRPSASKLVRLSPGKCWLLFRAFWLTMLAGHAPLLLNTCAELFASPSLAVFVRMGVLALTMLLFALKLVDVPWLRVPADPGTWLRISVIVGLMHAGVLARALEESQLRAISPVALSTIWAAALPAVVMVARMARRFASRAAVRIERNSYRDRLRFREQPEFSAIMNDQRHLALSAVPLRAPPVL